MLLFQDVTLPKNRDRSLVMAVEYEVMNDVMNESMNETVKVWMSECVNKWMNEEGK